jgi:KipI family sensor histidine kinase inhibitor
MESKFVLTRCGDDLFSIAVPSPQEAQALASKLREAGVWLEAVPGIDTVVIRFDAARQDAVEAREAIAALIADGVDALPEPAELLEIPVVYGGEYGPDLEALSQVTGRSVTELIALHTGSEYTVEMIGFTPGFAFIGGLDECFRVPRRDEPRQRVAAGSVGIADGRTGLYAMASPGGWSHMSMTVIKPGLQTTVQAGPRIGLRHLGVPTNGAADPLSLALANKLVGNAWDAAALEATLLGPTLRFDTDCFLALTGARATVTLNGIERPQHETLFARAGDELAVGAAELGARVYIAIAGGLPADEVLGSVSTNLQAGFGGYEGRALQAGDALDLPSSNVGLLRTPDAYRLPMSSSWAVHACAASETDLLGDADIVNLFDTNWTVGRRADRMGLRLEGPVLRTSSDGRMPSAGVFPGTIQCPEDGSPYVLASDEQSADIHALRRSLEQTGMSLGSCAPVIICGY